MLAIWKVQQCTDYVLAKTLTRKREGRFKLVHGSYGHNSFAAISSRRVIYFETIQVLDAMSYTAVYVSVRKTWSNTVTYGIEKSALLQPALFRRFFLFYFRSSCSLFSNRERARARNCPRKSQKRVSVRICTVKILQWKNAVMTYGNSRQVHSAQIQIPFTLVRTLRRQNVKRGAANKCGIKLYWLIMTRY